MAYRYVLGTYVTWKILAIVSFFFPILFIAVISVVPESPRFLVSKGQLDEANKALCWFRMKDSAKEVETEMRSVSILHMYSNPRKVYKRLTQIVSSFFYTDSKISRRIEIPGVLLF